MAHPPRSRDHHESGQNHDRIEDFHIRDEFFMPDPEEGQEMSISIAQKMLSAVSGSVLTSLLVTPLDVVRVRLQSQPHTSTSRTPTLPTQFSNLPPNLGISSCCREVFWVNNNAAYCVAGPPSSTIVNSEGVACAVEEANAKTFNSTLDGIRKIAKNEGPLTLWRGLSPTLAMAVPGNVIYFAGYDWLRAAPQSPFVRMGMSDDYAPLFAGSTARILAAIAVSPIEMFRTRMQATHSQPKGSTASVSYFKDTAKGMREMIGEKGVRSLWTGLTLTLWRDVPFSAIYWWGYEAMRNQLTDARESSRGRSRIDGRSPNAQRLRSRSRSQEDHTATLVDSFIAGATSGAIAAFVTTPFDVGKTRQQVVKHGAAMDTSIAASQAAKTLAPEELPMPRFLWHIFKEQGMSGLFRGWTARCLKVAPACAIMISSYEIGKKMAGGINHRRNKDGDR
jgi:solute carrier family 25 protein 39/40